MIRHGQYEHADSDEANPRPAIAIVALERCDNCLFARVGSSRSWGVSKPRKQVSGSGVPPASEMGLGSRPCLTPACAACRALLEAGNVPPVRHFYYSTMARATETGLLILNEIQECMASSQGVDVQPCSLIREGAVCRPEPEHSCWKPTEEDFAKEGLRAEAAFLTYFHRPDEEAEEDYTTVLVCHGNVIRYSVLRALQLPPEAWLRTGVANASVTTIEVRQDGGVSLLGFGESGHLEPAAITFN